MCANATDIKRNILFSGLATCVAEFVTLPICTIKTIYQNTTLSVFEISQKIYAQSGIGGFYRASSAAIFAQMISTSTKYTFYRWLCEHNNLPSVLNGMIGGIMSSVLTHPCDVVKIHKQMKTPLLPIIQARGLAVMYSGYSKSFAKVCLSSSLLFPLYDYMRCYINNPALAAFVTAVMATSIIHPVDFLKTRQAYGQTIWLGWNLRWYYRGIFVNLARVIPHYMITMSIIEALKTGRPKLKS